MEIDAQTINKMSKEEQSRYLKNTYFRKELFENTNHYQFVWLVQELKGETLLYLLDDDIIPFLSNDNKCADKLDAIMTCQNEYKNIFMSNTKVLELIEKYHDYLKYYISSLDLYFGKSYFNHIYENNGDLTSIGYLKDEVQLEIIKNNIEKIKDSSVSSSFLTNLRKETIEFLLNDDYFINLFLNLTISDIGYIIKIGVTLPSQLHSSKNLINKYLEITDVSMFNEYCGDLEKNNSYFKEIIRKKKNEKYINSVNDIDLNLEIFDEYKIYLEEETRITDIYNKLLLNIHKYKTKEERLKYLREITTTKLLEMIVDMNYEDITFNFLKNLESMLNFVAQVNFEIIPKERLKIYNKLFNFYELSIEEQIDLFNELANKKDNMANFYDDFRSCLNNSYKLIKESCFDCHEHEKSKLSNVLGIDVYELNGEPFKLLVNHTMMDREEDLYMGGWNLSSKKTASLSLIGNEYLGTFRDASKMVILGFSNFDIENIMHIHPTDSFSSHEYGSKFVIKPFTPDNFLKNTGRYNEILIKENNDLYPSYVVCYDEIKEGDLTVAKKLNIPLILIHTEKYNKKINVNKSFIDEDKYISHAENYMITDYKKGR